ALGAALLGCSPGMVVVAGNTRHRLSIPLPNHRRASGILLARWATTELGSTWTPPPAGLDGGHDRGGVSAVAGHLAEIYPWSVEGAGGTQLQPTSSACSAVAAAGEGGRGI
ncbi:unnamed protein product, partial [Urochloa humidicola]